VDTLKKVNGDDERIVPTGWAPWAKGFGALLDLNCALILLPVLRTIIRYLYDRSTADQGCFATALRGMLYFIPLDENLKFHKLIAKVILGATIAHTIVHYINFALRPLAVFTLFNGAWPLVSGGVVCLSMFFIYTAAFENTKRGQFEIFWYAHHWFIVFFVFLFTHGKNGLNPGFWRYIIGQYFLHGVVCHNLDLVRVQFLFNAARSAHPTLSSFVLRACSIPFLRSRCSLCA
jgi:NADPH oxidase